MKHKNWITILSLSGLLVLALPGAPVLADDDRYAERHRHSQKYHSRWDHCKRCDSHTEHKKRHKHHHHRVKNCNRDIHHKMHHHRHKSHRHADRHEAIYRKGYRHGYKSHRRKNNDELIGGILLGTLFGITLSGH